MIAPDGRSYQGLDQASPSITIAGGNADEEFPRSFVLDPYGQGAHYEERDNDSDIKDVSLKDSIVLRMLLKLFYAARGQMRIDLTSGPSIKS